MRRKFIAAIGGVAAMPFVATAQQTARIPRLVSCMAARRMIQKNRLESSASKPWVIRIARGQASVQRNI